jgi:hypothetical protein
LLVAWEVSTTPHAKPCLKGLPELAGHSSETLSATGKTHRAYLWAYEAQVPTREHLLNDATFAISIAVRLLSLPSFRLNDGRTLAD